MKREDRYIVLKKSDVEAATNEQFIYPGEAGVLNHIAGKVALYRHATGKQPLICAVVESDWPEYEHVWELIRLRVEKAAIPAETVQTIVDVPAVDAALHCFYEDATNDNAFFLVRAIMEACLPSAAAPSPEPAPVVPEEAEPTGIALIGCMVHEPVRYADGSVDVPGWLMLSDGGTIQVHTHSCASVATRKSAKELQAIAFSIITDAEFVKDRIAHAKRVKFTIGHRPPAPGIIPIRWVSPDEAKGMYPEPATVMPALSTAAREYIMAVLKDAAEGARANDPDVGIFPNDELASEVDSLISAVEDAPDVLRNGGDDA